MTEAEQLELIIQLLKRLNDLGDLLLAVPLAILFAYIFYRFLWWFAGI